MSFWNDLKKPIVGLSPMDGVTDAPMRYITKKYGQADVIYTEFVSIDGMVRDKKEKWRKSFLFDETERPVVAQIFGSDPEMFYKAAQIVCELGFDGVDINMGCPSPGLERRGGGAGLMRDRELAKKVIEATRKGVDGRIPVSVKTRIGSTEPDRDWWKFLAEMELPVVAMHGRTFKQLYTGEANWEILAEAAEIIKPSGALFLGNGDVKRIINESIVIDSGSAPGMTREIVGDGVLIGRAACGNPWALRKDGYQPSLKEIAEVVMEHSRKYEEYFCEGNKENEKRFFDMRKHLAWYIKGFPNAGEVRQKLVQTNSADEVKEVLVSFGLLD